MKKIIIIFISLFSLYAYSLSIDHSIYHNAHLSFKGHRNYLAMSINFSPIDKFHQDLQKSLGIRLKNRGEAHITIITPPEYSRIKHLISMQEINRLADDSDIQKTFFDIICLGEGSYRSDSTYFLVVDAPELFHLREKIEDIYLQRGGQKNNFDSHHYFPHITIGFTKKDLHESQGIIKDSQSCILPVEIK